MHLKYISKSFKKSLFEQMFTEHPEYKRRRRDRSNERSRRRKSSDDSDCKYLFKIVGDRNSEERIRIIKRWNVEFEREKDDERRKREAAEAKINFILIQQRIQENMNQKKNEKAENRTSK
jgi:hypothetical protein